MGSAAREAVEGLSPDRVSRDFADLLIQITHPLERAA
jgi:hypothetical protein